MICAPCASAALDGIIAPWAVTIVAVLRAIVETILAIVGKDRNTLQEFWRLPEARTAAEAASLDDVEVRLPAALGQRAPCLAWTRSPEFGQAVVMDLRSRSEARIKAQVAKPSATESPRRLKTVPVPRPNSCRHLRRTADMPPRKNAHRVFADL